MTPRPVLVWDSSLGWWTAGRDPLSVELGQRAWLSLVEENTEIWNKARLCAVLGRRFAGIGTIPWGRP